MLRLLVFATCLAAATFAVRGQELYRNENTCWSGVRNAAPWSLCFISASEVESSIYYPPVDLGDGLTSMGEGLGSGGRYWVGGSSIHFETTKDWLSEAWPWSWTSVTCGLNGNDTMIQLTRCQGTGETFTEKSTDQHEEPEMAFERDSSSVDTPTP